jgi:hypothetical protein
MSCIKVELLYIFGGVHKHQMDAAEVGYIQMNRLA